MPAAAVVPTPMAATPAPVTVAPAPMAVVPAPVMPVPAHLFGLQMFHLLAGGNGGTGLVVRRRQPPVLCERMRRKRRGLRARGKCGSAHGKSKGKFQKVAAFHDISSVVQGE